MHRTESDGYAGIEQCQYESTRAQTHSVQVCWSVCSVALLSEMLLTLTAPAAFTHSTALTGLY